MTLKLTTRPTTTATERHRREPGAVPVAPATRTMGSTGRMQGEMPVMSPATKPTRRRLSIPFREFSLPAALVRPAAAGHHGLGDLVQPAGQPLDDGVHGLLGR